MVKNAAANTCLTVSFVGTIFLVMIYSSKLMRRDATPSLSETGEEEVADAESELIVNDLMIHNKTMRRSRIKKPKTVDICSEILFCCQIVGGV